MNKHHNYNKTKLHKTKEDWRGNILHRKNCTEYETWTLDWMKG